MRWFRVFGRYVKVYSSGATGGSEMAKRRRFAPRLEAQVALEVLRLERTVQQIAAPHGVHPNQVSQWKREGLEEVFARAREERTAGRRAGFLETALGR